MMDGNTKDPHICSRCGAVYDRAKLWNGICWSCECEDDEAKGIIV